MTVSIQAALPLFRRTPSVVTPRMLYTSSIICTNPNGVPHLLRRSNMIPTPEPPPTAAVTFPFFSNPKIDLSSPTQNTTISKCFSSTTSMSSIPVSTSAGLGSEMLGFGTESKLVVVSFYKFADFPDHAELREPLKELCEQLHVSGGIILAPEGINGSICGIQDSVEEVLAYIERDNRLKGLRRVESPVGPEEEAIHHGHTSSSPLAAGEGAPFRWDHVRVKLKKEIVTLGMPSVSPIERVGKYVKPKDWNALISNPDVVVIDVRNDYETRIGKFKGAIDPCTEAFRNFPPWVDNHFELGESNEQMHSSVSNAVPEKETVDREKKPLPRVAMYCTGGIRCEKASSLLLRNGFEEVYHLEGGILKYLEEVPESTSLWEGECFVFDQRVSVEHGLVQGTFKLCYGCREPVSDADMESPEWEYGVTCPYCFSSKSEEEKERARARQRQFKSCGIIGGPNKGRKTSMVDKSKEQSP